MALNSGFFNAFLVEGNYDRKYNADDYSDNMGAIIRSGVLRDANNGFRVTASGLVLSVSPGRAWIEGRWAHLDSVHIFPAIVPPVGDYSRIDSVVLRLNTNSGGRAITLEYVTGTASSSPTAPAPERENNIYDITIAHVLVAPNASNLTVTDTRANRDICGWVTTPVGYDEFFEVYDDTFNDWFKEKRDKLASVTLFKQYVWRTVLESTADSVAFNIPQYDSTGVDIIQVYVNGFLSVEGIDYTLSGSVVTFTGSKVSGTEIVVLCFKSIDGTGLRSVSDEITKLQNQVATLGDISDYNYICTGNADNVTLSEIAQNFLAGSSGDYKKLTIRVYGNIGVTHAYDGAGTIANPYRWFKFGTDASTNRRVVFDFENCSGIDITVPEGSVNNIFYGHNLYVRNATVTVHADYNNTAVVGFLCNGKTAIEDCGMLIHGYNGCYIAKGGDFSRCNFNVRNSGGASACFRPDTDSLLRINGGECYAYGKTGANGMVIYVDASATNACVVCNGLACPTFTLGGFNQSHAVFDASQNGFCAYNNMVTLLAVNAPNQSITGTLKVSKYNRV